MTLSRRDFLATSATCAAHLSLVAGVTPLAMRRRWTQDTVGRVVASEPFADLVELADGIWAVVSKPLSGDRTTLANGGLIAGRDGVLAIEGFYEPAGAAWLAGKARDLTGRWPTHIALTHYHADHANGVAGYLAAQHPVIRATQVTRDEVLERNKPTDDARTAALESVVFLSDTDNTTLDLGRRTVRIVPRSGHTDSDISLELDDPSLVFCGDLFWNAMFPNYVDAMPIALSKSARALRRDRNTTYVPGHGAVGKVDAYDRYVAMIDTVEHAARRAHEQGTPAADAAAAFTLPDSLGEWMLFNKQFFERAFTAWYRDLER
jgi:glyoxylase-like metal-dependent hydrolase (beta-lactamase superfamily II)